MRAAPVPRTPVPAHCLVLTACLVPSPSPARLRSHTKQGAVWLHRFALSAVIPGPSGEEQGLMASTQRSISKPLGKPM